MISLDDVVSLSRMQFGATAMFHFLFVPLTLGLSWILVIAESAYVMTGKVIYKDITRFWGKLFGINFVMGVTTGITLGSSSVPTGPTTPTMSATSSARRWRWKG